MSNVEKFFKLYEELASEFPDHKGFIESLGVKQVRCFRNRINKYRKAGTVPPPSMLKYFKGVMDPNFLLEIGKSYRKEESEEVKQKRRTKKKVVARHYLEKAWNVEE